MITIFGSGIIGLFTAYKLLEQGKKVKIFEYKNNERGVIRCIAKGLLKK